VPSGSAATAYPADENEYNREHPDVVHVYAYDTERDASFPDPGMSSMMFGPYTPKLSFEPNCSPLFGEDVSVKEVTDVQAGVLVVTTHV